MSYSFTYQFGITNSKSSKATTRRALDSSGSTSDSSSSFLKSSPLAPTDTAPSITGSTSMSEKSNIGVTYGCLLCRLFSNVINYSISSSGSFGSFV